MENKINKSIIVKRDVDLKSCGETEDKSIEKYEYILNTMEKLTIEDFPLDIPEKSKQNIEKALRSVKMRKILDLGNGQSLLGEFVRCSVRFRIRELLFDTLLGLDEYRISNLQLTYQEKKFINEQVQRLIDLDVKNRPKDDFAEKDLNMLNQKYIEEQKDLIALNEQLLELRCEELELMLQVVDEIISPKQKQQVELQLENTQVLLLQIQTFNQTIQDSEMNKTSRSKDALKIISDYMDDLLGKCKEQTQ